jgi:hypothetical protein
MEKETLYGFDGVVKEEIDETTDDPDAPGEDQVKRFLTESDSLSDPKQALPVAEEKGVHRPYRLPVRQ